MLSASESTSTAYRVLLIDNTAEAAAAVSASLEGDPLRDYARPIELQVVEGMSPAVAQLRQQPPDAVLLSLELPDEDGLACLSALRDVAEDVPIVVVSANGGDEQALQALRAGADDCLTHRELAAESLPRSLRYAVERHRRLTLESELREAQAEVAAAEAIQRRLLPAKPPRVRGLDVAGTCVLAETVGGDLFDFLGVEEEGLLGVVADVSGHGLPAAILMTELHGLLHGLIEENFDLLRISRAANRQVDQASQSYQFITMLLYQFSSADRQFHYVSAGQAGWVLRAAGGEQEIGCHQLPLGVELEIRYELHSLQLNPGDLVVLPTDGVFEAANDRGEMFGIPRLLSVIVENRRESCAEILRRVSAAVIDFTGREKFSDDFTLVLLKAE